MKLCRKLSDKHKYTCELTTSLDNRLGYSKDEWFHFYIDVDHIGMRERCLPIRIPGVTIGAIWWDDDNIITGVTLNNVVLWEHDKTLLSDLQALMNNFKGEVIEFEDPPNC